MLSLNVIPHCLPSLCLRFILRPVLMLLFTFSFIFFKIYLIYSIIPNILLTMNFIHPYVINKWIQLVSQMIKVYCVIPPREYNAHLEQSSLTYIQCYLRQIAQHATGDIATVIQTKYHIKYTSLIHLNYRQICKSTVCCSQSHNINTLFIIRKKGKRIKCGINPRD